MGTRSSRAAGVVTIAVGLVLLVAMPAAAASSHPPAARDVAAARALVAAQSRYYAAGLAARARVTKSIHAYITHIGTRCRPKEDRFISSWPWLVRLDAVTGMVWMSWEESKL